MRWYFALSLAALAVAGGPFLLVAATHVAYSGFTEPMEGDVLQHVDRAACGEPLYPTPGAEYIALAHMPLYYYAAVPFYWIFGDSLTGPRLLAALCALASAGLVGRIAWRETQSPATGLLAGAFFCAGYRIMDACLFCALPDSLLLLWLLLGYWFWAYGTSRWADLLWLLCFTFAFWTKQHGAFFFGAAVLYALIFRRNSLPRWSLVAGLLLGGPVAYRLLGPLLGERFFYHTFEVPGKWEHAWKFSLRRTAFVLACFTPLGVVSAVSLCWRGRWRPTPLAWFTAAGLGTALVTMTAAGSSNNHYVPLLAMLSVVVAVHCYRLATSAERPRLALPLLAAAGVSTAVTFVSVQSFGGQHDIPVFVPAVGAVVALGFAIAQWLKPAPGFSAPAAALLLALGQLAVCYYSPARYLPRPGWSDQLADFRGELATLDRPPIWINFGNVPAALTGCKLPRAPSWVALEDVERQRGNEAQVAADLAPFLERVRSSHGLLLLSDQRIEGVPVWNSLAPVVELVHDYGDRFEKLVPIADHWYGRDAPPRFLYRVR